MHYVLKTISGSFTAEAPRIETLCNFVPVMLEKKLGDVAKELVPSKYLLTEELLDKVKVQCDEKTQNVHIDIWPHKPDDVGYSLRVHFSCIDIRYYPWFVSVEYTYLSITEIDETLADRHRFFQDQKRLGRCTFK